MSRPRLASPEELCSLNVYLTREHMEKLIHLAVKWRMSRAAAIRKLIDAEAQT